ncbi:MAG: MoxR family ATPase [Deltaproteobacteria bacterium]|nr:MoxR family ATPase [Deltaproteobacteria bacterium]MBW1870649.1 MoxR family ATPase [Deltaproteobacteria bacterium]
MVTDALAQTASTDKEAVAELAAARDRVAKEIGKRIVGQQKVIDHLMISLFSAGHSLFVGVPGLAKTMLISTLAEVLDMDFKRVQFTPDLMPADITGTEILVQDQSTGQRDFKFVKGPIFTNILLADEINRTPPKTQAALLQSMQEYAVTAGGNTHNLPRPYLVFATQNPIEQEGTYPLPEAELDRFMFFIGVDYPNAEEERDIVVATTGAFEPTVEKVLGPEQIIRLQQLVRRVPAAPEVIKYAVKLTRASRPKEPDAPDFVKEYVSWGAGPRASQFLILGGKARAVLNGRFAVNADDVRQLARPVLRHRIITNFHAEVSSIKSPDIVDKLLEHVKP